MQEVIASCDRFSVSMCTTLPLAVGCGWVLTSRRNSTAEIRRFRRVDHGC